ncbi:MAG: hypothetical protein LBP62_07470 [Clostridiales bacterium]|jgi:hypothetical protein|nr:hypothetical protein [Clostridiales bacterium]
MQLKREPEVGISEVNKLAVFVFFGFIISMVLVFVTAKPFLLFLFWGVAVAAALNSQAVSYVFKANKIAVTGKLTGGVVTGVEERPKSAVNQFNQGKKYVKISFEFSDGGGAVRAQTPWLAFSELGCPYFAGKEIRVAYTGRTSAVIIKRICDFHGKVFYSVLDNAQTEKTEGKGSGYASEKGSGAADGITGTAEKKNSGYTSEKGSGIAVGITGTAEKKNSGYTAEKGSGITGAADGVNETGNINAASVFENYENRITESPTSVFEAYGNKITELPNGAFEAYGNRNAKPYAVDGKAVETTAFKISEIKDKYTAVEVLSEAIGASKYDVRVKIETGKEAVFEIPTEKVADVSEKLNGIAVLTEN